MTDYPDIGDDTALANFLRAVQVVSAKCHVSTIASALCELGVVFIEADIEQTEAKP